MRGYKSETKKANLSSLRMEHLVQGLDRPNLRPVVVKQLLQGNKNLKSLAETRLGRASVDMEDIVIMRGNLPGLGMYQYDTVLLWFSMLLCSMVLSGSRRSFLRRGLSMILT